MAGWATRFRALPFLHRHRHTQWVLCVFCFCVSSLLFNTQTLVSYMVWGDAFFLKAFGHGQMPTVHRDARPMDKRNETKDSADRREERKKKKGAHATPVKEEREKYKKVQQSDIGCTSVCASFSHIDSERAAGPFFSFFLSLSRDTRELLPEKKKGTRSEITSSGIKGGEKKNYGLDLMYDIQNYSSSWANLFFLSFFLIFSHFLDRVWPKATTTKTWEGNFRH